MGIRSLAAIEFFLGNLGGKPLGLGFGGNADCLLWSQRMGILVMVKEECIMATFIRVYPGNAIAGRHKKGDVHFERDRRWVVGIWTNIRGLIGSGDLVAERSTEEALRIARDLQKEIHLPIVYKSHKRGFWEDLDSGELYEKLSGLPRVRPVPEEVVL